MEKNKNIAHSQISCHVNRIRRLYSSIGEPLDANVIIDLYCHLGNALRLYQGEKAPISAPKKKLS